MNNASVFKFKCQRIRLGVTGIGFPRRNHHGSTGTAVALRLPVALALPVARRRDTQAGRNLKHWQPEPSSEALRHSLRW